MTPIDPKSVAGVLLRDFDSLPEAIRYAERVARVAPQLADQYREAAVQLRLYQEEQYHGNPDL